MTGHHFMSYSRADGEDFALRLHDALCTGSPPVPMWLDQRELKPGQDWDDQLVEAIRGCASLVFIMTTDSVTSLCGCKLEWTRALKYKKPVIPILLHGDAEVPFGLGNRQHIDFTGSFEACLAKLRDHLLWLSSPAGVLQAMKDRLADAERDLRRTKDPSQQSRIQDDLAQLKSRIAEQERVVADPQGTAKGVAESIARGLERERQPESPVSGVVQSKFINAPPGVAPVYFKDRHVETKLIGEFLQDDSRRLMTVVGRGGVGKTAMVCRLLKALECGRLPDDGGSMAVDGIVYLSATGTRRVTVPNLYADLGKLLPDDAAQKLDALYKNPQASTQAKMEALLSAFPQGRTVLLLDNFEDVIDPTTFDIRDAELDEALRALLKLPQHAVKVILTTRWAPRSLNLVQPARQTRIDLDEGLPSPFAENILREMDVDGKVGLKSAPQGVLGEARQRTRGYPRALEALFAILSADRDTNLQQVLDETVKLLPENVVEVLVGEAFSRLEFDARRVMQALAVYGRPVTPTAVDYLLQPYLPGINSAPVLSRLVNMQFVRKEGGFYFLHPIDRAYALTQIRESKLGDRNTVFNEYFLLHRGAEYFKKARLPRENWQRIEDLAPQLAEFELRCAAEDYETAARVLSTISNDYLFVWGFHRLRIDLHLRLRGKLSDPMLARNNLGALGNAYSYLGQLGKAIECQEEALASARERKDRKAEANYLGNLGLHYGVLGQTARAIDYHEQALAIDREFADRSGEGGSLGNLGNCFATLGQSARAIDYMAQALAIARELKKRYAASLWLDNLAGVLIDEQRYTEAMQLATESASIANEIHSPTRASFSNSTIALIQLYAGDLPAARAAAEVARQYDVPINNDSALALLGVIALRQQDRAAARDAFATAVVQADAILAHNAETSGALDSKALALCGLALCGDRQHLSTAVDAYRKARAVDKNPGTVLGVVRLFDALVVADPTGILAGVRGAAAGSEHEG